MTLKAIQDAWIVNPSNVETAARMFRDNLAVAGWAVVPLEPTKVMMEAAHTQLADDGNVADVYRAMIAAILEAVKETA